MKFKKPSVPVILFITIVIVGIFLYATRPIASSPISSSSIYATVMEEPPKPKSGLDEDGQLIGMIWPPRLGPLHTSVQLQKAGDPCVSPYAEIYENKVRYRCQPNI